MAKKELDKETKWREEMQLSDVMGRYSQICTFLAGIFFTCILLIVQQKEKFEYVVEIGSYNVLAVDMVSFPLSVTFLLFVFDAFILATASQSSEHAKIWGRRAINLFYLGFIFMLISLFSILSQISLWLALIEIVIAIILSAYWVYER